MNLKSVLIILCGLTLLPISGPKLAQGATDVASASSAGSTGAVDPRQLIELGAGDSVSVHVYGQPDMDGNAYIGDDGTISVPLLGAVKVANLTPVEAAKRIEQALESHQLLINPHVTLAVLQSHSQLVSVLGEVHTPGRYAINPGTSVIELLAEAGGETENGANFIYVLRPDSGATIHRYRVDLRGVGNPNDPLTAEVLRAGDSVFVPRAQQFYIYGEVSSPGEYRLEPGMTVIQAIARAGGITQRGSSRRLEIKRAGVDGKSTTLRARPDDLVQPDDNIRVKESIF
jgi:polysaccharide export outer membrane protein